MSPATRQPKQSPTAPTAPSATKARADRRDLRLLRTVQSIRAGAVEYRVYDASLAGLGVHCAPSGKRSWFIQYTTRTGTKRRQWLGDASIVLPQVARTEAMRILAAVATGADPMAEQRAARLDAITAARAHRESATIADVAAKWLDSLALTRSPRWAADARRLYDAYLAKRLGAKKVADLDVDDVRGLHEHMAPKPVQANRVRAVLSAIVARAIADGHRPAASGNPVSAVEPYAEQERDRFLNPTEWDALGKAIAAERAALATAKKGDTRRAQLDALVLATLTGARIGSLLPRKWDDVDWEGHVIRVSPPHKGATHVYVGEAALALLRTWQAERSAASAYIFPGQARKGKAPSPITWTRVVFDSLCERAKLADFHVHDLRRSYATAAGDAGVSALQVAGLLNHVVGGVTGIYLRRSDPALCAAATTAAAEVAKRLRLDGAADPQVLPLRASTRKRGNRG